MQAFEHKERQRDVAEATRTLVKTLFDEYMLYVGASAAGPDRALAAAYRFLFRVSNMLWRRDSDTCLHCLHSRCIYKLDHFCQHIARHFGYFASDDFDELIRDIATLRKQLDRDIEDQPLDLIHLHCLECAARRRQLLDDADADADADLDDFERAFRDSDDAICLEHTRKRPRLSCLN